METQNTQQQQATNVATQSAAQNATAVKRMGEETVSSVMERVQEMQEAGQLVLPTGYHYGNALKAAWLYLQEIKGKGGALAIESCTKASICNCLLQMTINGEHPGKHCYFIPTGNTLSFWEKYTGKLMRAKRDAGLLSCNAQVVYDGDEFTYTIDDNGEYQLVSHTTKLENINVDKIRAAYAVVVFQDGSRHLEVMTMEQIRKSWGMGAANGASKAHMQFADQMAKRTIINRACKIALESHSEAYNIMQDENIYHDLSDGLELPSQHTALRDMANRGETPGTASNAAPKGNPNAQATFAEPADYEELTPEPVPAASPSASSAPKASTRASRACPV